MPVTSNNQGRPQAREGYRNNQSPTHSPEESVTIDTSRVRFEPLPLTPELFSEVAKLMAKKIAEPGGKLNKQTQIRKFYNELCMWEMKVSNTPEKFDDFKPFILMLNAKAAYARGRGLIDANFQKLLADCLKEGTKNVQTFRYSKIFFEAFLGFYRELGGKD